MFPSTFFSYLTGSDRGESVSTTTAAASPGSSGATGALPSSSLHSAAAAAPLTPSPPSVRTSEAARIVAADGETHFSLPKRRPAVDGATDAAYDTLISDADKPNMLKEWCGILYYSARDVTVMGYKKAREITTQGFSKAAFEDEAWPTFFDPYDYQTGDCRHSLFRYYAALPTTRTCSWMLPRVRDAPLVMHLAILFIGLEAVQVSSFYLRYRRAMKENTEAMREAEAAAEAEAEADEALEDDNEANARDDDDEGSVNGERTQRGGLELSPPRAARTRLPRGSSRALHRLCSYWALVEKAVRRAPQKHAGVPTTAAELGRFFNTDSLDGEAAAGGVDEDRRPPASTTSDGASARFTSDGVPHGADRVLVLSDDVAFPVIYRSRGADGTPTAMSVAEGGASQDPLPRLDSATSATRSLPSAAASSTSPPPSASRRLPPVYPSPDSTLRSYSLPPSPPPQSVGAGDAALPGGGGGDDDEGEVRSEVAQPWRVLHALWTDTVRYSVNYTEIRQLLLSCSVAEMTRLYEESAENSGGGGRDRVFRHLWRSVSRQNLPQSLDTMSSANLEAQQVDSPLHMSAAASFSAQCLVSPTSQAASPRFTDGRVCVVCMALTWYLSVIREVYEAVVVHQDVQRCADALDELEEFQRAIYQRGVEAGATFFEEAMRCAQPQQADSLSQSRTRRGRAEMPRRLLLPQVGSEADVAGEGYAHEMGARRSPPPPPPPSQRSANESVCDAAGQHHSSSGGGGQMHSNPLAFDFAASPTIPLPAHRDRRHFVVTLRGASPKACWAELTAALAALLRRRRLMELACVRSLFCYMYTGSAAKMVSFAVLALLTSMSSRVAALGQATREAISTNLDIYYRNTAHDGVAACGGGGAANTRTTPSAAAGAASCGVGDVSEGTPAGQRIIALFIFECTRLAVNTVLAKTTHEYITLSASQRRNTVKAELYEALTRMPLAFFDLHSYDEVEQIVYYVNDIEGVEVHVHNYCCGLITSLFAMHHAMGQLPNRARLLVGLTVAASFGVKYIGQRVTSWTQAAQRTGGMLPPWLRGYGLDGTVSATAELDAQVEENMESNARQGGVMLRGLDIVAVLPQLRPYAADISLMRWWTDHTRTCGAATGSTEATTFLEGLLVVPRQLYGKALPAFGAALMTFADWVLPTVVSSYGASLAFSGIDALSLSNRLIEAMRCVGDTVEAVMDARRVAEVVLLNAYKANVLEKILDHRRWEPTTMDYMEGVVYDDGGVKTTTTTAAAAAEGSKPSDHSGRTGDAEATNVDCHGSGDVLAVSQRRHTLREGGASFAMHHQQALAKSFRRGTAIPAVPLMTRLRRTAVRSAAWLVAHSPPVLAYRGASYLVRKGVRRLGFVIAQSSRSPSALAGAETSRRGRDRLRGLRHHKKKHTKSRGHKGSGHHHDKERTRDRHRQHPHQSRDEPPSLSSSPPQQPQQQQTDDGAVTHEVTQTFLSAEATPQSSPGMPPTLDNAASSVQSPFFAVRRHASCGGGSVSDGNCTEAYFSDVPPGSQHLAVSSSSSSSSSFSGRSVSESAFDSSCSSSSDDEDDDADVNSEAAAAAAAAALVHATVHTITVQNLQFFYPTAPTVPVFPKPISFTVTLQSEEWLAPSLAAPAGPRSPPSSASSDVPAMEQLRGRLVCLVGPSGHGKSTLLSLLLGMYTHYSTPSQQSGAAALPPTLRPSVESSDSEGAAAVATPDTLSYGSPRTAEPAGIPGLPADILLTLRMPNTSRRRRTARGGGSATTEPRRRPHSRSPPPSPSCASASSFLSAGTEVLEEQLPVSVIPRDILRGNLFSFVPQSPVIFSGATIAHNISLENFISLEQEELLAEIAQCAAWAHCEYIQRFPQGLMTYIADSGTGGWSSPLASAAAGSGGAGGGGGMVRLSGGQAQRLMMARALFHGRRGGTVLVMDEPTASLDHEVKLEILAEWRELLDRGIVRGMICATHDADLMNIADEIVRLP